MRVEERAHSESVPGNEHRVARAIVDRECELAVEAVQDIDSPFLVAVNEDLSIGVGAEDVPALLQLPAQLRVIVNLAVVGDDYLAILIG